LILDYEPGEVIDVKALTAAGVSLSLESGSVVFYANGRPIATLKNYAGVVTLSLQ
jgi:L-lactate permease